MKIYRIAKSISSGEIRTLEKARDIVKKVSKSFRGKNITSNITSIGFDLDEEIYQLTKKD